MVLRIVIRTRLVPAGKEPRVARVLSGTPEASVDGPLRNVAPSQGRVAWRYHFCGSAAVLSVPPQLPVPYSTVTRGLNPPEPEAVRKPDDAGKNRESSHLSHSTAPAG